MDSVLGVQYNGGVVLATDQTNARSIVLNQSNMDKIAVLTKYSAMAVAGPNCDLTNFTEFIHKNLQLYELANDGMKLSTHAQANFCRNELAKALRKGPYQVNTLIGGYDSVTTTTTKDDDDTTVATGKSSLYYLDYLGCLHKLNYACQGYCNMFCAGIMDREYKASVDDMTLDDALSVIEKCMKEIQVRFLVSQPNFIIKIIDKDGVRVHSFGQDPTDN